MPRVQRKKWFYAALLAGLFILVALLLEKMQPVDAFVYEHIASLRSPFADILFQFASALAGPIFLILCCFLLVFTPKCRKYRIPLMLNLILTVLLNIGLKSFFARARPTDVLTLATASGYSFPSGHTMSAACFYGFLIFLLARLCPSRPLKAALTGLLFFAILLAGASRVYLGVHYFSDVFAGLCVSACYLIGYTSLVEWYVRHPEHTAEKVVPHDGNPIGKSFSFAIEGIVTGLNTERNMVIHFGIMMLVVVFGTVLSLSIWEWIVCILLFGLVFMAELFNTSIETIVDIVMPQKDPRAKVAKDTASGAVLAIAIASALIGAMIFIPKLLPLLQGVLAY